MSSDPDLRRAHSYSDSSGNGTHGQTLPQSPESGQERLEYDRLMAASRTPPPNCCTWKVATTFLIFVAVALVVTWQTFPAEAIVAKYIPQFDEPEIPYSGPEAGAPSSGGTNEDGGDNGGGDGDISIDMPTDPDENLAGTTVPSFMKCPEAGGLCCNGSPENCRLRVDQTLFGMVHNSMSSVEGGFTFGYNHNLALEKALVAGYRGLSLDVCNCNGALQFCHNVCNYGERNVKDVFSNTAQFLDDYPSEVVVLQFQASIEQGPIVWDDLYLEMTNVKGFVDMIYVHRYGERWPTMGELVEQNTRIILFYFNGGTCNGDICPPGFEYFYNYAAETQYKSSSLEDLRNVEYSCEITRGPKADALPADFLAVNNFVTPPDERASTTTNSRSFLTERLTNCANMAMMRPNFVYLDFWSQGVTAQLIQNSNKQYAEQLGN